MSVLLERRAKLETLTLERFIEKDAQGAPSYASGLSFEAKVLERDIGGGSKGARYVIGPDGTEVRTPLTLYVPGSEDVVPEERDRVVRDGGAAFIAVEVAPVSGLRRASTDPSHTRVRCKDE